MRASVAASEEKKHATTGLGDLVQARLEQIIKMKHELVQLESKIDWETDPFTMRPCYA